MSPSIVEISAVSAALWLFRRVWMEEPGQDVHLPRVVCESMLDLSSLCHVLAPAPRLTPVLGASMNLTQDDPEHARILQTPECPSLMPCHLVRQYSVQPSNRSHRCMRTIQDHLLLQERGPPLSVWITIIRTSSWVNHSNLCSAARSCSTEIQLVGALSCALQVDSWMTSFHRMKQVNQPAAMISIPVVSERSLSFLE